METLQQKMKRILTATLKDGDTDLETLSNGHVCGDVISSEFADWSYEQRHRRIREILEDNLQSDELANVSTLLSFTPAEWSYEPEGT